MRRIQTLLRSRATEEWEVITDRRRFLAGDLVATAWTVYGAAARGLAASCCDLARILLLVKREWLTAAKSRGVEASSGPPSPASGGPRRAGPDDCSPPSSRPLLHCAYRL